MQLLAEYGPDAPAPRAVGEAEALGYVRGLALGHYENFSVLSALVPAELRDDFAAVYAFCRWADDLGDETGDDDAARERSLKLLAWWRGELQRCFGAVDSGQWTVESDRSGGERDVRAVDSGQWTVDSDRSGGERDVRAVESGQWTVESDRSGGERDAGAVESGQWTVDSDRSGGERDAGATSPTVNSPLSTVNSPPLHPVFVALRATVARRRLTIEPFDLLIQAFEQDQRVREYRTWEELIGYCRKSADPVGRIVLSMFGHPPPGPDAPATHPDRARHEMSDAICTALQLTNFWQDVRRDLLERDRVYLPAEETGISAEMLRRWVRGRDGPDVRVPFIRALRPLVERTWALYEKGRPLPGTLAPEARPVVWLFAAGGRRVLRRVEEIGCTTLWKRPKLRRADKLLLVARAFAGAKLAAARRGR